MLAVPHRFLEVNEWINTRRTEEGENLLAHCVRLVKLKQKQRAKQPQGRIGKQKPWACALDHRTNKNPNTVPLSLP